MPETFELQIQGLDEIEKRLKLLPEKLRRKALRDALNKGAEMVRAEAEAKAIRAKGGPTWPEAGHMADAIVKKVTVRERFASARVGINWEKIRHGHLVEFGTKAHRVGKRAHPGARKQPFMRPAYEAKGDAAVKTMTTDLARAVEKEV